MASVEVRDASGEVTGTEELDPAVFGVEVNRPLMHQAVVAGMAALRAGTHSAKTRGEVRGGGRKPWRQKGTGRARAGSIRAPHWTGGGVAMGPRPRDHSQRLPKKMRRAALRSALSVRAGEGRILVVEDLAFDVPRTKDAIALLAALEVGEGRVLLVLPEPNDVVQKAFRNLPHVRVAFGPSLSTYEVLAADYLVFTRPALALAGVGRPATDKATDDGTPEPATRSRRGAPASEDAEEDAS